MDKLRRRFMASGLAGSLWLLSPEINRSGKFTPMREAEAAWMMAASAALSAMSAFNRSDGGMGAMLSAIRDLQQENILLTQKVLATLADIQRSLGELPELLRSSLRENSEYRVREETTDAFNRLLYLERERREGRPYRADATHLIERCVSISRFQSVPHGIGGVGAMCAPIVATVDARARRLTGKASSVNNALETFYIPWLRAMRSPQDGSLWVRFLQAAQKLKDEMTVIDDKLSARSKAVLSQPLHRALALDPGAPKATVVAECARVKHHYSTREVCVAWSEGPPRLPVALRVDAEGRPVEEAWQIALRECVESRYIKLYRPGPNLDRVITAENVLIPLGSPEGQEPGPRLSLDSSWVIASDQSKVCADVEASVAANRQEEVQGFINASEIKGWQGEFEAVKQTRLANVNDLRQQLFAFQNMLTSARESENLLVRVTQ